MPLYEMFLIVKCSTPEHLTNITSNVAKKIWSSGGVVRDVKILSDRILPKQLKSNDGETALIGRYTQILFDGSPIVMHEAKRQAQIDKSLLKLSFFRVKDFYSHAQQYHKQIGSQLNNSGKRLNTARKISILKEEGDI